MLDIVNTAKTGPGSERLDMVMYSSRARTVNFYFHLSIYSSRLCVACNEKLLFVYTSV